MPRASALPPARRSRPRGPRWCRSRAATQPRRSCGFIWGLASPKITTSSNTTQASTKGTSAPEAGDGHDDVERHLGAGRRAAGRQHEHEVLVVGVPVDRDARIERLTESVCERLIGHGGNHSIPGRRGLQDPHRTAAGHHPAGPHPALHPQHVALPVEEHEVEGEAHHPEGVHRVAARDQKPGVQPASGPAAPGRGDEPGATGPRAHGGGPQAGIRGARAVGTSRGREATGGAGLVPWPSRRSDSNRRPPLYESGALPAELLRRGR